MPLNHLFIINRAGSLIYETDVHAPNTSAEVENLYQFPLEVKLQVRRDLLEFQIQILQNY